MMHRRLRDDEDLLRLDSLTRRLDEMTEERLTGDEDSDVAGVVAESRRVIRRLRPSDRSYAAILRHRQAQERYDKEVKALVRRRLEIILPDVTDDEVDLVYGTNGLRRVYEAAVRRPDGDPIAAVYKSVTKKHTAVLRLQASILELTDLLNDFASIVTLNGDHLENL